MKRRTGTSEAEQVGLGTRRCQARTFASSISGETGGLSEREPPPLRGPLLCESRPEVSGATSCCKLQSNKHVSDIRIN
jgi:hypothetical protein